MDKDKDEEFIEYPFKQKQFYINKIYEDNESGSKERSFTKNYARSRYFKIKLTMSV
jgi:hypothetical protein